MIRGPELSKTQDPVQCLEFLRGRILDYLEVNKDINLDTVAIQKPVSQGGTQGSSLNNAQSFQNTDLKLIQKILRFKTHASAAQMSGALA